MISMKNLQNTDFLKFIGSEIQHIQEGARLARADAQVLLFEILTRKNYLVDTMWVGLFSAIQTRKPTKDEVLGFLDAIKAFDENLLLFNEQKISAGNALYSITGSGKDTWKTFNISTTASFVAAACGISVFKPGSSALTSTTGASDVLKHLGIVQLQSIEEAHQLIDTTNFAILDFNKCVPQYAKRYNGRFFQFHPLSYILPPLAIPFSLNGIIHGISDDDVEFSLNTLANFGPKNIGIVTTKLDDRTRTDEFIPFGRATLASQIGGIKNITHYEYPIPRNISEIHHHDNHSENAKAILDVLQSKTITPSVEAAAMAAATMMVISEKFNDLKEAYAHCVDIILVGRAFETYDNYRLATLNLRNNRASSSLNNNLEKEIIRKAENAATLITGIGDKFNYTTIAKDTQVRGLQENYLEARFLFSDTLEKFDEVPVDDQAIITGFGPTNAPTAGTLSVMLKVIGLHKRIGCATEIIISDLGAFLSRNNSWQELSHYAEVFQKFVDRLVDDSDNIVVRTHIDKGNLSLAPLINEYLLTTDDFLKNKEITEILYEELGLLGNRFGIIADSTFTVCDILKPFFNQDIAKSNIFGKRRVLVVAGIEEHYFPRLATIAINTLKNRFGDELIHNDTAVSALFTKLIPGFPPYPKMSKSIPDSSINLADTEDEIVQKIVHAPRSHDMCIFEMIMQASEWDDYELSKAKSAFTRRNSTPNAWNKVRIAYAEDFIKYSKIWAEVNDSTL